MTSAPSCPTGDGGTLTLPNDIPGLIQHILSGDFLTDGAKAIAAAAQGVRGSWNWLECSACHRKYVQCGECQYVWFAEATPNAGDIVVCPQCHQKLV
jgi:hypothetical protein